MVNKRVKYHAKWNIYSIARTLIKPAYTHCLLFVQYNQKKKLSRIASKRRNQIFLFHNKKREYRTVFCLRFITSNKYYPRWCCWSKLCVIYVLWWIICIYAIKNIIISIKNYALWNFMQKFRSVIDSYRSIHILIDLSIGLGVSLIDLHTNWQ